MKTCVIYAASIFDPSKLVVIDEFFSMFKAHFSDADFYIGVNPGSIPTLEDEIKKYGLNCHFVRQTDALYTRTDASAFQAALKVLKDSNNKYDFYWFAHTKGGVNPRSEVRSLYFNEMFNQRISVEKMFVEHPHLGSWGLRGNSVSAAGIQWNKYNVDSCVPICDNSNVPPFVYTHVNWSYIETMYVLKKEPTEAYISMLSDEYFTKKMNPWYFETVVPWAASRCGYFPYVKVKKDYWERCDLTDITKKWIEENKLPLEPYLSL